MATTDSRKAVWITLATALISHSLLLSFQINHRLEVAFFRGWILDSLTPVEKLVDRTLNGGGNIWSRYVALIGVYDENQRLRAEADSLKIQLAKQQENILEAERLRKLLNVDEAGIGKTVVARVIGRDTTLSHSSVTIDKGRVHGIQTDAAVLTPEGVVGRVIYAGNYSAVVQLIVDAQSAIGVLVLPGRRIGIIKGNATAELELDYIDDDTELKEGDSMITSGDDRIYPKGLPVGVITFVGPRRGMFKSIRVKPRADLGRLEEVLCVIDGRKPVDVPETGLPTP